MDYVAAFILGGVLGVVLMALCVAASKGDEDNDS